jgi:hypothetical protein
LDAALSALEVIPLVGTYRRVDDDLVLDSKRNAPADESDSGIRHI